MGTPQAACSDLDGVDVKGPSSDAETEALSSGKSPKQNEEDEKIAASRVFIPEEVVDCVAPQGQNAEKFGQDSAGNSRDDASEVKGEAEDEPPLKKYKEHSEFPNPEDLVVDTTSTPEIKPVTAQTGSGKPPIGKSGKKSKKSKDVWTTTTRKGKKKVKNTTKNSQSPHDSSVGDGLAEEKLFITPITRFPDRSDDGPEMKICLSKVYKAEKVELSDDRLSASSTKGYRMVRATRGVSEGAWYFEISLVHLGETGHTRLGWSTEKGDLQAPVGYDENSYGYRDIDGSKVHKALREEYGSEGYKEGDVIGFYINLPSGEAYAPAPRRLVWHKGQRYVCAPDDKEDSPKVVP
ncbi:hypothetical protein M569_03680, partial [Genlisea aurea]